FSRGIRTSWKNSSEVSWAVAQPAPLLAANLQRSEIMRIYRERPPLPGTASRRDSVRLPLLAQIRESHCGMLPDDQLPAMLAVQQQRDRRMLHWPQAATGEFRRR
ncbi:ChaN family lipoprotein, partial [Pseudomonas aeruginosa]|uniref:ChaN family lipoprotein n=1 Tax=Pseudomonas aeruginosa TaxID=287 RepID=UPI00396817A6